LWLELTSNFHSPVSKQKITKALKSKFIGKFSCGLKLFDRDDLKVYFLELKNKPILHSYPSSNSSYILKIFPSMFSRILGNRRGFAWWLVPFITRHTTCCFPLKSLEVVNILLGKSADSRWLFHYSVRTHALAGGFFDSRVFTVLLPEVELLTVVRIRLKLRGISASCRGPLLLRSVITKPDKAYFLAESCFLWASV